jgi:hypothetical protein
VSSSSDAPDVRKRGEVQLWLRFFSSETQAVKTHPENQQPKTNLNDR